MLALKKIMSTILDEALEEFEKILDPKLRLKSVAHWTLHALWTEKGEDANFSSQAERLLIRLKEKGREPEVTQYTNSLKLALVDLLNLNVRYENIKEPFKLNTRQQIEVFRLGNYSIPRDRELFEAGYTFINRECRLDRKNVLACAYARGFLQVHQTDRRIMPVWRDMLCQGRLVDGVEQPNPSTINQSLEGYIGLCMMPRDENSPNTISPEMIVEGIEVLKKYENFTNQFPQIIRDLVVLADLACKARVERQVVEDALPLGLKHLASQIDYTSPSMKN